MMSKTINKGIPMKTRFIVFMLITNMLIADNEAILGAISTFNVKQLERELQRHGALKRNIKKEYVKVLDGLIAQEAENNVWYKKYDALAHIGISIPLLILSFNYLYSLPRIREDSITKDISSFFSANSFVLVNQNEITPETKKSEEGSKLIPMPNTILTATAGFLNGVGLYCLSHGLLKLLRYTPRYIAALAMKTIVLSAPDAKSEALID
jgi:hypothetical protein